MAVECAGAPSEIVGLATDRLVRLCQLWADSRCATTSCLASGWDVMSVSPPILANGAALFSCLGRFAGDAGVALDRGAAGSLFCLLSEESRRAKAAATHARLQAHHAVRCSVGAPPPQLAIVVPALRSSRFPQAVSDGDQRRGMHCHGRQGLRRNCSVSSRRRRRPPDRFALSEDDTHVDSLHARDGLQSVRSDRVGD